MPQYDYRLEQWKQRRGHTVGPDAPADPIRGHVWIDTDASGTFSESYVYVSKTTTYTATSTDSVIFCSGTWTLTLPTPVGAGGKVYRVINTSTGSITVVPAAGLIHDQASDIITGYEARMYISDNVGWWVA